MPSASHARWASAGALALNQIEAAHRSVGGPKPGRRYATEQINHAYAVLLLSQFQRYCRDLHSESVEFFLPAGLSEEWRGVLRKSFLQGRKLDSGNPNPGNIGADFSRFGIRLWDEVGAVDLGNLDHKDALQSLSLWRNAIAHQDFSGSNLGSLSLRFETVRSWRRSCRCLATAFDRVMRAWIREVTGRIPWDVRVSR
jgi:hypothetical protein